MNGIYKIVRPLARGGMAQIYLAKHETREGFSQNVVIKRILPAFSQDPGFVRALINEAKLCANLTHPNIVQVHDIGQMGGDYFLVMEYVRGFDLDLLLNDRRTTTNTPLPLAVSLRIMGNVLAALAFAHTAEDADGAPLGVIHRDVTPANIMVAKNGHGKLADFGIAKANSLAAQDKTEAGKVRGKVSYLSPEQIEGRALDQRVDLFMVGVVLYQCLTGRHPFHASNDYDTASRIVRHEPDPVRALVPQLPDGVTLLMEGLLAKKPERRFASAAEALDVLEGVAQQTGAVLSPAKVTSYLHSRADELEKMQANLLLAGAKRPAFDEVWANEQQVFGESSHEIRAIHFPPLAERQPSPTKRWPLPLLILLLALGAIAAVKLGAVRLPRRHAPPIVATVPDEPASAPDPVVIQPPPLVLTIPPFKPPHHARRGLTAFENGLVEPAGTAIHVIVIPWAQVFLDGKSMGTTPIPPMKTTPGKHTLRLVNTDLVKEVKKTVNVRADETVLIKFDFVN
jgi:eukaryotic-like serine/threonine-protein kinase